MSAFNAAVGSVGIAFLICGAVCVIMKGQAMLATPAAFDSAAGLIVLIGIAALWLGAELLAFAWLRG